MTNDLRIGVIGATGALGSEVLALLAESSLHVKQLVPIGTERSLGQEIEFRDLLAPVETDSVSLRGLDLVFLCAPEAASMKFAQEALRAEVACIDVSGALCESPDVELRVAVFGVPAASEPSPLLVAPPGACLPLALVLRPLEEAAGLRRVTGTVLEGASSGGRQGIESLYRETVALFNQEEPPDPTVFPRPVAFDCGPIAGDPDAEGPTDRETRTMDALTRLLLGDAGVALTHVQVPTFIGFGASVALETERLLDPTLAEGVLGKAAGVERWDDAIDGLTLRAAAGREEVLVGRVRQDPSCENGLLLWIVADVLRVAAANAVRLAVARFGQHH